MELSGSFRFPLADYCARVGLADGVPESGSQLPDFAAIAGAQFATIPFENLDIHRGIRVGIEPQQIVEKLINNRRGGICYELNGLLLLAFRALGINAESIGAQVRGPERLGPPLGHMAVLVSMPADKPWLVDVGFGGEMVCRPVDLGSPENRLVEVGGGAYLLEGTPRPFADFEAMAWWHSTSPRSRFTGSLICTRTVDGVRSTLTDDGIDGRYRLVVTDDSGRHEATLDSTTVGQVLAETFAVGLLEVPSGVAHFE